MNDPSNTLNSRKEADQAQRKEIADAIKDADPETLKNFIDWMNRLILEEDYNGED